MKSNAPISPMKPGKLIESPQREQRTTGDPKSAVKKGSK